MNKGDKVTIYNTSLSGKPFKEGIAELIEKLPGETPAHEYWQVRFLGEPDATYPRWIETSDHAVSPRALAQEKRIQLA